MSDHLYWLDSRTPTIHSHITEPSFRNDPFDASDHGLPSLEEITHMVQRAFDEALQERGYNSIAYAEPEPVYEPPSSRDVARSIEPNISTPDTFISVSAAVIYDVLDDFVADQSHLAPIVSIAGYNDFKRQFDALTDPLVSLSILQPHVRDAYFADALQLSPLDHAVIYTALASIAPDADQSYPMDLVDAAVRQYFAQVAEPDSVQESLHAYVNDPDVFAARSPPSCPLFNVAISDSATQDDDFILHPHSGSYTTYTATGLSARGCQLRLPCPSPLDLPTTQCTDDLPAPYTPYVPPYTPDFDRSDAPDRTFPPYEPPPISLKPQLCLGQPQPSPPALPYVPSESVPSPHGLFKHGAPRSSLGSPKSPIEVAPDPNVVDTDPTVKMSPNQDLVEHAVALPPVRDADPLSLKDFHPQDFAVFQSVQPLLQSHGPEPPDSSFAVPPSPAIVEDTVVPPRNAPSSPQTEYTAAEDICVLPPEIRPSTKPYSDDYAASLKSVPCLSPRKPVRAKPAPSPPDVTVENTGPEIVADSQRQPVMVVQDEPRSAPLPSLSPRSEFPIVAYSSPPSRPSMVDILATAYPARSPRRLPLHLALRPRRVPPHFRFRHNVLRARSISAPRVRAPGSDPPCQPGYPLNINAPPVTSPLPC
ncbi:unnamed protein product [Peniophora sp. CBMAI 1063]|nr:unnamed protein product [Peniophora sp. CBMAI 1063]